MRILLCPDDFKGTLSADAAARAMAAGWLERRPADDVLLKPMSDGGPGFVAGIAAARGVALRESSVRHALGRTVQAQWCIAGDTAYLEAAQVVGLTHGMDVMHATSFGLATLLRQALEAGASRIVLGMGGTCINDGGAGLLQGLGAHARDASGAAVDLRSIALLSHVAAIDLSAPWSLLHDVDLVIATDVDVPLLGPRGATYGFAQQKGALETELPGLEAGLSALAAAMPRRSDGKDASVMLGAGAAGGLGFGLLAIGARRVSGFEAVWQESQVDLMGVDLVITGEGRLDWQSMRGKVVSGVARKAQDAGVPVVAIAGAVTITPRERSDMGLDACYSITEWFGADRAMQEPEAALSDAATRLVRTWGPLE